MSYPILAILFVVFIIVVGTVCFVVFLGLKIKILDPIFSYNFKEYSENKFLFKRIFPFKKLKCIDIESINEITLIYFQGKYTGARLFCKKKKSFSNLQLPREVLENIAKMNKIKLSEEEIWHGGEYKILYEPIQSDASLM